MAKINHISKILLTSVGFLALAACGADDVASPGEGVIIPGTPPAPPAPPPPPPPSTGPADNCPTGTANVGIINNLRNCQLSGTITGALTIRNLRGVIYSFSGRVAVGVDVGGDGNAPGGAQGILTIEPGTVLFGSSGADFLLINRGSQLFAEGTMTRPIIMTSRANIEGTSTDNSIGQWGGVVVLGRAPISDCIGAGVVGGSVGCQGAIEGVNNGFFGGAMANDNSGRIRFLQIRYPGFEVAPGNELNGLTLGGVGRGTTVDHIQVHNSSDDGIEWFGGTVNSSFLVLTGNDDDNLDTDIGYIGYTQFVYVNQRTGGGDRIIEADSPGNTEMLPRQNARLANFTFVNNRAADPILLRGGTDYTLVNGVVTAAGTGTQCVDIDEAATIRAADATLQDMGPPTFRSNFFGCAGGLAENDTDVNAALVSPLLTINNNIAATTNSLVALFAGGPLGFPGAMETAVTAFDPTTLNTAASGNYFVAAPYAGAFRNAQDTWFAGWTCGLATGSLCTQAPANTGS